MSAHVLLTRLEFPRRRKFIKSRGFSLGSSSSALLLFFPPISSSEVAEIVGSMELDADPPKILTERHKCSACYKQYKKKETLIEHMRESYHSIHQPKCGVCKKYCKSFESLREHLTGPLPKANCSKIFTAQGCDLCMNIFDSSDARDAHKESCRLSPSPPFEPVTMSSVEHEMENLSLTEENHNEGPEVAAIECELENNNQGPEVVDLDYEMENCRQGPEVIAVDCEMNSSKQGPEVVSIDCETENCNQGPEIVAVDCEMVGGGSDGSLDICARVCLIDEEENVIFHTYVEPLLPVTNYRYEITGIKEEHMKDAMPLKQVHERIQDILYNGESIWRARREGGKAKLLVGHNLEHDLDCLRLNYPDHLLRDTARYQPLMKTNLGYLSSHSLKYLTKTYLGYEIQNGTHDPYQDCVAALRLYKRMRSQVHQVEGFTMSTATDDINPFDSWKPKELENMSPDVLFRISQSKYRCWCLDLMPTLKA